MVVGGIGIDTVTDKSGREIMAWETGDGHLAMVVEAV